VRIGVVSGEQHRRDSPFVATDRPRLSLIVATAPAGWSEVAAKIRLDGDHI
jgi:hypothetical protein